MTHFFCVKKYSGTYLWLMINSMPLFSAYSPQQAIDTTELYAQIEKKCCNYVGAFSTISSINFGPL